MKNLFIKLTTRLCYIIVVLFGWQFSSAQIADRGNIPAHHKLIDVLHYAIRLDISDLLSHSISGNTELIIKPGVDKLSSFQLDLLDFHIDSVLVNGKAGNFTYDGNLISISVNKTLSKEDTVVVNVFYNGQPAKDEWWGGFYFTDKYAYNYGVGMAAEPPTFGRAWYPCIDNFTDRATYDYYITVDSGNTAVCCGVLVDVKSNKDNRKTYHWKLSHTIPTYLSSIAVSGYEVINYTYKGVEREIPVCIYVEPGNVENAGKTFVHLENTLKLFEDRFGPYAWQRVGYVTVPYFGGAMEHATNITLSESSVNGTLSDEYLIMHELSHSWFGNLVTCRTEQDMWLNEGWASYCEAVFMEGVYGNEAFKSYNRNNHRNVLEKLHIQDDGYRPLYGNPHRYTYSGTVYDKGADVVHTLRGYLGDSLFFSVIKQYLKEYAFRDISTCEFRDFLSAKTGIDLNDFFDTWVLSGGFPHFSIEETVSVPEKNNYGVTVNVKQSLLSKEDFSNSNSIDITFMNNDWNTHHDRIRFSGEKGSQYFLLSFEPSLIMLDPEEKTADATVDNYKIIKADGEYYFENTAFNAKVSFTKSSKQDSILMRAIHNYIPPSGEEKDYLLSAHHYWTIEGIFGENTSITGAFLYNTNKWLDASMSDAKSKYFVLLYREKAGDKWQETEFSLDGDSTFGQFIVNNIRAGDYTIAVKK